MTHELTRSSLRIVIHEGLQVVQKQASSRVARMLLENEVLVLGAIAGLDAPSIVSWTDDGETLTLYQELIQGITLTNTPLPLWHSLLEKLENSIQQIHALGIVHGDLKPSNLIVTDSQIRAIDWEHALPMGAQIADLPFRAVSLGTSDPSLIWGRGLVTRDIDHFSIKRMYEMAAARCLKPIKS